MLRMWNLQAHYISVKEDEHKVYICLFTCATTQAVYLEVVPDLTVKGFMLAFRKFTNRKSLPKTMLSDNASTNLVAAEEIKQLH